MPTMNRYQPLPPFTDKRNKTTKGANNYIDSMYGVSRHKPKTAGNKAKMLTFYKNGDQFDPGVKVSLQPGKHFATIDNLYDYLTQKTKLPRGVRYIFTLSGKRLTSLDDFEDRGSYVVSDIKTFHEMAYGASERSRTTHTSRRPLAAPLREEDMKLFRPVSPGMVKRTKTYRNAGSRSHSLPSSNEGKIITVVNGKEHHVYSRILLNLRATQTFEDILKDLGQAVKLKDASKMYSQKGQEIRSFSQLREELKVTEKFYLDSEERNNISEQTLRESSPIRNGKLRNTNYPPNSFSGSVPNLSNSHSTTIQEPRKSSKDPHRVKAGQSKNETTSLEKKNSNRPSKRLELEWVHGYNCRHLGKSLYLLLTGELLYTVTAVAVLYHRGRHKQRHYLGHTEDIDCMAVHPLGDVVATAQGPGMSEKSQAHIRIWRIDNLVTLSVVGLNRFDSGIITCAFSPEGNTLLAIEEHILSLWDWSQDTEIGRASLDKTDIFGSIFLTIDKEIAVTYGKRHLTLWRRAKDDILERQDLINLMSGFASKTVMSFEALPNGAFLTGDSDGYLALWLMDESTETYFISKEIRAHGHNVNTILLLPGELLVTGSSVRKEGEISIWNLNDKLSRLMTARLPPETGEVKTLCPPVLETYQGTYYVGTSNNIILEGSLQGTFTTIIHGHQEEIRALAVDPYDAEYVTAGMDKIICKWDKDSLLWKVLNISNCFSLAIHPESTVVAVGEVTGNVVILNLENGDQITRFSVSNGSLNTMSFSPDGSLLAIGSDDGNVYLYLTQNDGCKYSKGGVMKGLHPILILDWARNGHYIQTVVSNDEYHELVVWNVKTMNSLSDMSEAEQTEWQEITCTLGHNVFGIWTNQYFKNVINVSCHRSNSKDLLAVGDRMGFVRLFKYPCIDSKAACFEQNHGSSEVTAVRFLAEDKYLASAGSDGVLLWRLEPTY